MKKKNIFLPILILAIILQGFVTSLHPLYTAGNLTYDNRLVGTWKDPDSQDLWKMENLLEKELEQYKDKAERSEKEQFKTQFINRNTYLLTYTEKGESKEFKANLVNCRTICF